MSSGVRGRYLNCPTIVQTLIQTLTFFDDDETSHDDETSLFNDETSFQDVTYYFDIYYT